MLSQHQQFQQYQIGSNSLTNMNGPGQPVNQFYNNNNNFSHQNNYNNNNFIRNNNYFPHNNNQNRHHNSFNNNNNNFNNNNNSNRFKNNNNQDQNQNHNNFNQDNNSHKSNSNQKNRNQQNKNTNKPKKANKRELPENNAFYCEVCDRGFKTEEKYDEHCGTHVTCSVDGCKFMAASKLVEIHFSNFHATGLDKKVSNSLDDVAKYIDERRKNFPSKASVEKKATLEELKESQGVLLTTEQFGKLAKKSNLTASQQVHRKKLREEGEREGNNENEEKDKKKENKKNKNNNNKNKRNKREGNNSPGNQQSLSQVALRQKNARPTLLQRLLADEIRHERNLLLQCVRYCVQNAFFDETNTSAHDDASYDVSSKDNLNNETKNETTTTQNLN